MKKQLKQLIAFSIAFITSMGILQPAFASSEAEGRTYEFMQEGEKFLCSSKEYEGNSVFLDKTETPEIVTTYIETNEKSYEIFTYKDGVLIEIVECSIGQDYIVVKDILDGEIINEEKKNVDVKEQEITQVVPMAYSNVGTMDYYNSVLGTTLSITVSRDDYTIEKTVTFKDGRYTAAQIAGFFVSAWFLPLETCMDIAAFIFGNYIVNEGVNIIGTKKVVGTVTEYTWKGVPNDKKLGSTGYLDGLKVVYKDKNNSTRTHTEGYQPSAWKTDPFGRIMFYEVYRLEVYPTKWR